MERGYEIDYEKAVFFEEFQRIQPADQTATPVLKEYWTANIDPQHSKGVIELTKAKYTTDSTKHLKRFRKRQGEKRTYLEALICPKTEVCHDDLLEMMRKIDPSVTINLCRVPTNKPMDKQLNKKWSEQYWPIIWKGNPMVQEMNDSYRHFGKDNVLKHLKDLSERSNRAQKMVTMLVDRETGQIRSVHEDERSPADPMRHSAMCCIEEIAENELKSRELHGDNNSNNYLCLNLDVYTTHEPCTMCAMALLHSRIGRLFFIAPSPATGALLEESGCGYMIHLSCTLNWKYESFQYIGGKFPVVSVDKTVNC